MNDWRMYHDAENDISYVMDPKTVDKDEQQKAIDTGKGQHIEFLKKNCTFTGQPKHLFNKEKWSIGSREVVFRIPLSSQLAFLPKITLFSLIL